MAIMEALVICACGDHPDTTSMSYYDGHKVGVAFLQALQLAGGEQALRNLNQSQIDMNCSGNRIPPGDNLRDWKAGCQDGAHGR